MIVYGKHRRKYSLSKNPVSRDYDGAVYTVSGNPDIQVKIYLNERRTAEKEKEVIDTVNGVCSMLGEMPIDVVYGNGRFVGYVFETSEESIANPFDPTPAPAPAPKPSMGKATTILCLMGIGLVFSLLVYFLIFGMLSNMVSESYIMWNLKGIPMIVGGLGLMIFTAVKFGDRGVTTLLVSGIAYVLGSALVFGTICMLVALFTFLANLVTSLLPLIISIVVTVVIIVVLVKVIMNLF